MAGSVFSTVHSTLAEAASGSGSRRVHSMVASWPLSFLCAVACPGVRRGGTRAISPKFLFGCIGEVHVTANLNCAAVHSTTRFEKKVKQKKMKLKSVVEKWGERSMTLISTKSEREKNSRFFSAHMLSVQCAAVWSKKKVMGNPPLLSPSPPHSRVYSPLFLTHTNILKPTSWYRETLFFFFVCEQAGNEKQCLKKKKVAFGDIEKAPITQAQKKKTFPSFSLFFFSFFSAVFKQRVDTLPVTTKHAWKTPPRSPLSALFRGVIFVVVFFFPLLFFFLLCCCFCLFYWLRKEKEKGKDW